MGFDRKQKNSLITGLSLSAELTAVNEGSRRFVTLFPYTYNDTGRKAELDKFVDTDKDEKVFFNVRDYEYPVKYIENDWEVYDGDIIYHHDLTDIKGITALEQQLSDFVDDFSQFVPLWKTDDVLY